MDYDDLARLARAALIVAAQRRSLLTYGDLGQAIGWDPAMPLSHHMKRILDRVSQTCIAAKEPSLAALVVNGTTGKPGDGWVDGGKGWHWEAQRCFRTWSPA